MHTHKYNERILSLSFYFMAPANLRNTDAKNCLNTLVNSLTAYSLVLPISNASYFMTWKEIWMESSLSAIPKYKCH